ncbi:MAG: hypothetical protein K8F30_14775, partial [Taibaiella sp.]|nr:hypothetical protein [Taibaiella sp.]
DLINKPAGYAQMMEEINDVREIARRGVVVENQSVALETAKLHYYFVLNDGKTVEYGRGLFETINKMGHYYARTKQTADVYKFLQDVVKAYYDNGLDAYENIKQSDLGGANNGQKVFSGDTIIPKLCSIIESTNSEQKTFNVKTRYFENLTIHTGMEFKLDESNTWMGLPAKPLK